MTDSVTLRKALEDVGTADVGLLEHCIARVAPGLPPFGDDGGGRCGLGESPGSCPAACTMAP